MRFAFAALAAVLLCPLSAHAESVEGVELTCTPMKDKAKVVAAAEARGFRTVRFDADATTAFLKIVNERPPVTHLAAEGLTVFRASEVTVIGLDIGDRFCMAPTPIGNEEFDSLMETATGQKL
jgi:hypothetical protein